MRVLIVGGGSAGWIVAATLHSRLNGGRAGPVAITLIESPDTPKIGVGEATIPTIRNMLRSFGLSEAAFMNATDATFKHGIRFDDWSGAGSSYLHPFQRLTLPELTGVEAYWLGSDKSVPFADLVSPQTALIAADLAPRRATDPEFGSAALPYAYHMDAEMFAELLARQMRAAGVAHETGHVAQVQRGPNNLVTGVTLTDGRLLVADLFVDCSGFAALLSPAAHAGAGWVDQSVHLLCDSAVTLRAPQIAAPRAFTSAKALSAGWTWDIGLQSRRGRGYVYSSKHLSPEEAEAELRRDAPDAAADTPVRHLHFRVGRQTAPWQNNVVAIGLAAGFVEPLESTGLYLADLAARLLCEMFPPTPAASASLALAKRFNQVMGEVHDSILDFLTLHYATAKRRDTAFWRDASDPSRYTANLALLLDLWEQRPPSFADFSLKFAPFLQSSHAFILLGSGWHPAMAERGRGRPQLSPSVAAQVRDLTNSLPPHQAILDAMRAVSKRG
jgi:tryptophan 7-halogenase